VKSLILQTYKSSCLTHRHASIYFFEIHSLQWVHTYTHVPFFLFGSCFHIYRLTHPHILLPNKPCMLMMFRSQFCILSILTSTCTLSILYMLVITPSIFFLKEIERPKTPVPLEQTCVDDFHTPDKVCTLPQYISN